MPIVNHLSYKMKGENENSMDDVKLVGYVNNNDDGKESIEDRLGNSNIPQYWKTPHAKEEPDVENGLKIKNNAYYNAAYHATEQENCKFNNRTQNGYIPQRNGHSNGNTHGNYQLPQTTSAVGSTSSWKNYAARKCCSKKVLYKRIPILNIFGNYTKDLAISDLIAGITVGLTVIPQSIAYANVAGLPPKYGLYSSFLGCFIYVILGSIKESSVGTTAISAILIRENIHGLGPSFAILLCFLTGVVQLAMGFLRLGFLVDFISGPVSAGFTSAAAIIIAMTQVKDLFGLNFGANKFMEVWNELSIHFREIKVWDTTLGFSCIVILFFLRKVKDIRIGPADTKDKTSIQKFLTSFLWFLSTGRNILVVVICTAVTFVYKEYYHLEPPYKLSAAMEPGLPRISSPPFTATVQNKSYNFFEMASNLGSGVLIVPLISLLEDVSLAKVFSDGKSVDATQELLALGTCNLLSSFISSMPLSGSLSRGAVNAASGVKTTFGSIYAGTLVIISLQFLTPYFAYIPKASLAAVIVAAVVFMVEFQVVKPMWKTKKIDLIPAVATFLGCLLIRLEVGILIGVSINVLFLLHGSARPTMQVDKFKSEWGYEYIVITPDRSLAFPSVEYVRSVISKAGIKQGNSSIPVVIDSRHIQGADFTAAKGIKSLIDDFMKRNQLLVFYNLKPSVVEIFQGVKPTELHYCQTEQQLHDFLKVRYFWNKK